MFRMEEFPEVWADACLRDSEGRLMFLSVYGRDGSLMQLLAAFELGRQSERGVDCIYLVGQEGERHRVDIADAKRLEVADQLQKVAGSERIPVSDGKLTVVLEYPQPASGGELSPQERRTADRILAYILPRLTRELARSKSLTVTQRPRPR